MNVNLTKEDAQEVLHKLGILANEPELQQAYGLNQAEASRLYNSVPQNGGEWVIIANNEVQAVRGEMRDHTEVLRDIAQDARRSNQVGQALRISKQAARFEKMFCL